MNYENFKEQLIEDVKKELVKNEITVNITTRKIVKPNESYDAIVVTPEKSNIGANININYLYGKMMDGVDYDAIIHNAIDNVINAINKEITIDTDVLNNYEKMRSKLALEVVSSETNSELLKNIPHKIVEDMAVIYRFTVDFNEDGNSSVLITNQMINDIGITTEQLHEDAVNNAESSKPAIIIGITELLAEMTGSNTSANDEVQMFVATTPDKIHGASIITYKNFMEQAAERLNGDFYILPSSIHEIILIPDDDGINLIQLQNMVRDVNSTEVLPEDKLTDSVYHYDSKNKIFELGEKFIERQAVK